MTTARRVMMLEFNELSPLLMNRFMAEGNLPNFQRLHDESQVYVTEAAERGWELNPWVQWVTVHSGLDYRCHGITELDEGGDLKAKRVWDVVSEAGLPVWVCGSMNVAYHAPLNGLMMPDPWTTKIAPQPDTLQPFFRFVQQNVLDHSKDSVPLARADYLSFLKFMLGHGLSFRTVKAILQQLLSERSHDQDQHWKRAVLLDKLQFDVFSWYYRKTQPHFSTFFSNSTAHYQHYYWREMEPDLFKIRPTDEQRSTHEAAILFGYQEMDKMIARFLKLAGPETIVVFATAISQQPCLAYEEQGGKVIYRPRELAQLMKFADITEPHTVAPVMAEVFNVHLRSEKDAESVEAKLRALQADGRLAMQVQRKGTVVNAKCLLNEQLDAGTTISRNGSSQVVPFFDLFYQIEDIKSGMHHPDGMFWIRMPDKRHRREEGRVALASVAPTLLGLLSLPCPAHMDARPIAV